MMSFADSVAAYPVIAAVRDALDIPAAAKSCAGAVFLLGGSILTLPDMVRRAGETGKPVLVHIDLLDGLGHDASAVEWCHQACRPDGLISTRAPLLKRARELGLMTVQRLFVMDSSSITHGVKLLRTGKPDMVEILPGLIPKAISSLAALLPDSRVIAGGMITERAEVFQALSSGAIAVSSSERALWGLTREELGI